VGTDSEIHGGAEAPTGDDDTVYLFIFNNLFIQSPTKTKLNLIQFLQF
jgi:hypothetical protein